MPKKEHTHLNLMNLADWSLCEIIYTLSYANVPAWSLCFFWMRNLCRASLSWNVTANLNHQIVTEILKCVSFAWNKFIKETPTQILWFDFFLFSHRQTNHVFFCTFIAFDAAVAILGRTCHCSLTFALCSSVHKKKPNFPYPISFIFIWRMCVCVSSRQETMCSPRLVHYVCNKNMFYKKNWREKKKRKFTDSTDRITFFWSRPKSSRCRFLSTMKYSVRLSFRHDILVILPTMLSFGFCVVRVLLLL